MHQHHYALFMATSAAAAEAETPDSIDQLLSCGICSKIMLFPVIGQCGHALGCRACVETFFEEEIARNQKKRKATRLRCEQCGEDFAKPSRGKKLCVDYTLGELCRQLRPDSFGTNRATTAQDAFTMETLEIKNRLVQHPIPCMPRPDLYNKQMQMFLDDQAKSLSDLRYCKCTSIDDSWPRGILTYPKWSKKSSKWFFSCPMWTPGNEGTSCNFFEWVSSSDVARYGLKT